MIALLALLQASSTAPPPPRPPVLSAAPADWSGLPDLIFVRRNADVRELSQFVRDEIAAGRCAPAPGGSLRIELAVLLGDGEQIRRVVPRAVQCPTVEQYASGLILAMARGNVVGAAGWYRTALTFAWAG